MHRFHELLQLCEQLGVETSPAEAGRSKELPTIFESRVKTGVIVFSLFLFDIEIVSGK